MNDRFAVVDLEHAGVRRGQTLGHARIVELAIVHVDLPTAPARMAFASLIRPPCAILAIPGQVHGIGDADVAEAPTFDEVAGHVGSLLAGRVLVAHNVAADRPVLEGELSRQGLTLAGAPWLCTMRLSRALGFSPCDLGSVAREVYGRAGVGHAAPADAWMTHRVLIRLLARAAEVGMRSLADLGDAYDPGVPRPAPTVPLPPNVRLRPRLTPEQLLDEQERVLHYAGALVEHLRLPVERWSGHRSAMLALRSRLALDGEQLRTAHRSILGASFALPRTEEADHQLYEELRLLGWAPGQAVPTLAPAPSGLDDVTLGRVVRLARQRGFIEDLRSAQGALWVHGLPPGIEVPDWSWSELHKTCRRPGYHTKQRGTVVQCMEPLISATALDEAALTACFGAAERAPR